MISELDRSPQGLCVDFRNARDEGSPSRDDTRPAAVLIGSLSVAEDSDERAMDGSGGESHPPADASADPAQGGIGAGAAAAVTPENRAHRIWVRVILGLATVLAVFAIFAIWANRQLMNPTNWANTSTALLQKQTIRSAVSGYLVDQLYANVDVEGELKSGLPKQLAPLAGPISGGLHNLAEQGAERALGFPRVQDAWRNANRAADQALVTIVNGGGSRVQINGGTVSLNLRQIVADLAQRLGLPANVADKLPAFGREPEGGHLESARAWCAIWPKRFTRSPCAHDPHVRALRPGGVPSPRTSPAHADVGWLEPRLRRPDRARRSQGRTGPARLGDHQRCVDRTRRQRCLLGCHLAAGAGRERLDHHRHPRDLLGVVRGARRAGRSPAGASGRRTSASVPAWPTGSPQGSSPSSSSGARSHRRATH